MLVEELKALRTGASKLEGLSGEDRNRALIRMRDALDARRDEIKAANAEDIERAKATGIQPTLIQRLKFTDDKINSALKGIEEVAALADPVGRVLVRRQLDDGLVLEKVTFPIGVIAMIFESRPDALVQISSLALKSGNAVCLKGGREATLSNRLLIKIIREAVKDITGEEWILGIESHEDVDTLLKMEKDIDLVIPRGSNAFVRYVMDHTRIPVLGHADGICAVYVDKSADLSIAVPVTVDSKVQYPAACNAAETILVNREIAPEFLPLLAAEFEERGVKVHATEEAAPYFKSSVPAVPEDFDKEYLALECAVKLVDDVDEAISHILAHGSHHTDTIITECESAKKKFFSKVDSADVFCNCSTRFADGFRFGLGAEVGISTSKIHARGPVGLEGLMTTKYLLTGNGQIVATYSGKDARPFKHKELL